MSSSFISVMTFGSIQNVEQKENLVRSWNEEILPSKLFAMKVGHASLD